MYRHHGGWPIKAMAKVPRCDTPKECAWCKTSVDNPYYLKYILKLSCRECTLCNGYVMGIIVPVEKHVCLLMFETQ